MDSDWLHRLAQRVGLGRDVPTASLVGRALRTRRVCTMMFDIHEPWQLAAARNGVRALPSNAAALVLLASALWHGPSAIAAEPPLAKLRAVPFMDVTIQDSFWAPRRETNRIASIPFSLQKLEEAGNIENMRLAARHVTKGFRGPVFMDSDLYKALEAASYSLATHPDPALEKQLDDIIAIMAAAQQSDGYLNSYYTVKEPGKRWTNLRDCHELYCAGHMFEAAVAHYQATGKSSFLSIATRYADYIDSVFGPPPKRLGYPGHPEIELALIKLWRATGNKRYFDLARFFAENRGRQFFATEHNIPLDKYDGSYFQDDVPIHDHQNIKGHAVRAAYLMSGVTEVASQTGDERLFAMLERVWRNTTERNQYITGGIGPSAHNEGFTVDYDLPNQSAYQETCATIALAQWAHRLALLHGDAYYADAVERALYNGVLSGVSQDGTKFFYVNPLESAGTHHRSPWFGCACCPPNVTRTLAALGGYAYAVSADSLYVNLCIQGSAQANVGDTPVTLKVKTDYPWEGKIALEVAPAARAKFALRLRVPGWCRNTSVAVNHRAVKAPAFERGYLVLDREWKRGDRVDLELAMPVERVAANPRVKADQGLLAIQRGPIVYCLEQCDQSEPVSALWLPLEAPLKAAREPGLLGGVVTITGEASLSRDQNWRRTLYQAAAPADRAALKAIPYYAWDNRKAGAMKVWLPVAPPVTLVRGLEAQAKVSVNFANDNCQPQGINDGVEPKSSGEQPNALCHWWPHNGTEEWAQYTWKQPVRVSGARAYWFDDTGRGNCRLPKSWRIEYRDGSDWKPVTTTENYQVPKDQWCAVRFAPVKTTALRLLVQLPPNFASGVHEWEVDEVDTTDLPPAQPRLPRTNLLVFHDRSGAIQTVRSKSDWQQRRAEIVRGMVTVMGPLPGKDKRCPLDMQVEQETDCGSYVRRSITYAAEPGARVPAYLLIPKAALAARKKFSAMLALHPTDMQYGHRVVAEELRANYRAYGRDLAERGYVVLAPAYPIMAGYQPDLKALGYQSGTMKAIRDNIRGLDLLESLRFVRKGKLGAIGHSLGGHNAIYTAVLDPRIQVVVSSCGFDSYVDYYNGDPANWQPERGWCQTRYMLRLADYRGRLEDIPFDFSELIGALAPRPMFVNAPLRDANFRWQSVDQVINAASAVYRLYGVPQNLRVEHPDCEHDFPPDVREAAYRFLDEHLR